MYRDGRVKRESIISAEEGGYLYLALLIVSMRERNPMSGSDM